MVIQSFKIVFINTAKTRTIAITTKIQTITVTKTKKKNNNKNTNNNDNKNNNENNKTQTNFTTPQTGKPARQLPVVHQVGRQVDSWVSLQCGGQVSQRRGDTIRYFCHHFFNSHTTCYLFQSNISYITRPCTSLPPLCGLII